MTGWRDPRGQVVLVTLVMVGVLAAMGRTLWCRCGELVPWSFDIWSMHNSQHLVDPYQSLAYLKCVGTKRPFKFQLSSINFSELKKSRLSTPQI